MFRTLIVCKDNWDTVAEIPYILKDGGCKVDLYCSDQSWLLSNKFYDTWVKSGEGDQEFVQELLALVQKEDYDWVILADEPVIHLLNNALQSNNDFLKLMPLTKPENREVLSSKIGLSRFCEMNAINTPRYQLIGLGEDKRSIKTDLRFPVIVKTDFSWGGAGMFIVETFEKLADHIRQLPAEGNIIMQEYITGKEYPVEALFFKGELLMYQTSTILTFNENRFSYTTQRNYFQCDELESILRELGKKLGLNGFANIAYIQDQRDGSYQLIEVDTRPNSWTAMGRFLSSDLLDAIRYISKRDYSKPFQQKGMGARRQLVSLFYKDFRRAYWAKDFKSLGRWFFNINGHWKYVPFYDRKLLKKTVGTIGNIIFDVYKQRFFSKKSK